MHLTLLTCAGYTLSAGIACNKLLAKVAAGLHKPDQQTIVPPRCLSPACLDCTSNLTLIRSIRSR